MGTPMNHRIDLWDTWDVEKTGKALTAEAVTLSHVHIKDSLLGMHFVRDVNRFEERLVREFKAGQKTKDAVFDELKKEMRSLQEQSSIIESDGLEYIAAIMQLDHGAETRYTSPTELCHAWGQFVDVPEKPTLTNELYLPWAETPRARQFKLFRYIAEDYLRGYQQPFNLSDVEQHTSVGASLGNHAGYYNTPKPLPPEVIAALNFTAQPERVGIDAYELTEKEWNDDLQKTAKKFEWDMSQQNNVCLAVLTVDEACEYLELLKSDTHGQLSTGKDYVGVGTGLKSAYDVAAELGGWGATTKAVNINGVMNIVIEDYIPKYLDLGTFWKEATPQMLKMGYALNTIKGNLMVIESNIYTEIVFSGAVNAVDYMLHDEKTLGEVVGEFSADVAKNIVAGVIAQGATLLASGITTVILGTSIPTAIGIGLFVYLAFEISGLISDLDEQYEFTEPMKNTVEKLIDEHS